MLAVVAAAVALSCGRSTRERSAGVRLQKNQEQSYKSNSDPPPPPDLLEAVRDTFSPGDTGVDADGLSGPRDVWPLSVGRNASSYNGIVVDCGQDRIVAWDGQAGSAVWQPGEPRATPLDVPSDTLNSPIFPLSIRFTNAGRNVVALAVRSRGAAYGAYASPADGEASVFGFDGRTGKLQWSSIVRGELPPLPNGFGDAGVRRIAVGYVLAPVGDRLARWRHSSFDIVDARTGNRTMMGGLDATGEITDLAFSEDGARIAVGRFDGVEVYRVADGTRLTRTPSRYSGAPRTLRWIGGTPFIAAAWSEDARTVVELWDTERAELARTFELEPQGGLLAADGATRELVFETGAVSTSDGEPRVAVQRVQVVSACLLRNRGLLVLGSRAHVQLVRVASGEAIRVLFARGKPAAWDRAGLICADRGQLEELWVRRTASNSPANLATSDVDLRSGLIAAFLGGEPR